MWPGDALPQRGITNWSVFTGNKSTSLATGWNSWMKPPGCKWVYIFAIGAGGGGGRPANGNQNFGGGGGGSGSITRALFPAQMFPDIIYIRGGNGGAGATTASNAGSTGLNSYISIAPNITAQNAIFIFSPGAGGAANATGGTAGALTVASSGIWINSAIFTSLSGQAGASGSNNASNQGPGGNITFGSVGLIITGGGGGGVGQTLGTGGSILAAGPMPLISGGTLGPPPTQGANGFNMGLIVSPGLKSFPMLFSGGGGGAGGDGTNQPTKGGDAAYGSGGGGGGGGRTADSVSGNGGNGGDALIMIGAF